MFGVDFPSIKIRNILFSWMKLLSFICALNVFAILMIQSKACMFYSLLLPFINVFIIDILFGVLIILNLPNCSRDDDSLYIEEHYPAIWKRLHPWGRMSHSFFPYLFFINNKYDNGKDEKLNYIKKNEKDKLLFVAWVNLLTPVVWIVDISIYELYIR